MPSDAAADAAKTTSWSQTGACTTAAIAAATAASATGPRKNRPGVRIAGETERRRQRVEVVDPRLEVRLQAEAVDEHGAHAERTSAFDVVVDRVADHRSAGSRHLEQVEHRLEDRRVRLGLAVVERADPGVDLERVMTRERVHVAR